VYGWRGGGRGTNSSKAVASRRRYSAKVERLTFWQVLCTALRMCFLIASTNPGTAERTNIDRPQRKSGTPICSRRCQSSLASSQGCKSRESICQAQSQRWHPLGPDSHRKLTGRRNCPGHADISKCEPCLIVCLKGCWQISSTIGL
jgi:hypothetical protein